MPIEKITLLQNVGKFDNASPGDQVPFKRFTVVYAENGSGKTTLSTIFKSLSKGDPYRIMDRKRITSANGPHIILNISGHEVTFANERWSHIYPDIHVFDDIYVSDSVCSGIEIEVSHRRNMHEFIIGHKGVELYRKYQEARNAVEIQKKIVDEKRKAISSEFCGPFSVDDFCNLSKVQNIDEEIRNAEYHLASAKSSETIRLRNGFIIPELPKFNLEIINKILETSLENVEADTSRKVKEHFEKLGQKGEEWVADGIPLIEKASACSQRKLCPFCDQDLSNSSMIACYKHYFSKSYEDLKEQISRVGIHITSLHSDQSIAAFEIGIRDMSEAQNFWKDYTSLPTLHIDVSAIKNTWVLARDGVLQALRAKMAAPLDKFSLSPEVVKSVSAFDHQRNWFLQLSDSLKYFNSKIDDIKKTATRSDISTLEHNLEILNACKIRFSQDASKMCEMYDADLRNLNTLESTKDSIRNSLDQYRQEIFPKYRDSINGYLLKFGAGFQVGPVAPINDRGGSSIRYSFIIDNAEIPLNSDSGPSFRNSLSAGDRSTLAFAFFLAMLDNDENINNRIVVIDDPVTSLDESRMSMTREVIKSLIYRVQQVIVLSHRKLFLYRLWDETQKLIDRSERDRFFSGIHISRGASGSVIELWNASSEDNSTYDRSHNLIQSYINNPESTRDRLRDVGVALRIKLEGYLRIVFPEHFPQGMFLGGFVAKCEKRLEEGGEIILSKENTDRLRQLKDYANQFHHSFSIDQDHNINEIELLNYSKQVLDFCLKR